MLAGQAIQINYRVAVSCGGTAGHGHKQQHQDRIDRARIDAGSESVEQCRRRPGDFVLGADLSIIKDIDRFDEDSSP
ncbi:MAG: hypothetical protein IPG76_08900 [Acidobacteria bacterium]|nr:hypothetical protein [Acidobacteriota bacterium]